ncbi:MULTISPECIES: hypothetical protein [unclassified Sphingomonas]|uniref:hypothetical protein n=1 Tax=unclassified Sphingomonas TaxID=196159 RepID=UPI0021510D88|nr:MULTISPECIES: hypothetical protein [unclassified Sphingomonas]MCR5871527.1 hypothetical protein [Sphingomonas sp. J344]UUY00178.1 hypothetical protein LRS08_03345 [Sphingomonas sp. J315]
MLIQAALIAAGAATLAFWPPREGPMLLVALDGRDGARLVGPALNAGATLAGRGPMANMILVSGTRAHLAPLLGTGVIALAAPRGLCSQGVAA